VGVGGVDRGLVSHLEGFLIMAWKEIAPLKQVRNPNCVRFYFVQERKKERVNVMIGKNCLAAAKLKVGDRVDVVWDDEKSLLGFRKSDTGRTISGKTGSGWVMFDRLQGRPGKAMASMLGKMIDAKADRGLLVIECAEYLK
jgi:hypothetical protein